MPGRAGASYPVLPAGPGRDGRDGPRGPVAGAALLPRRRILPGQHPSLRPVVHLARRHGAGTRAVRRLPPGPRVSVSYTHLDVYKRQVLVAAADVGGNDFENNPVLAFPVAQGQLGIFYFSYFHHTGFDVSYSVVLTHRFRAVSYTHLDVYKRQP